MTEHPVAYHDDMQSVQASGPRELKRLTRPDSVPGYALTERDVFILMLLAQFRWLTSEQIVRRCQGSHAHITRRLKILWADGLIYRPDSQLARLAAHHHHGPPPLVYGLARKGAHLLTERGVDLRHRIDWTFRPGTALNLDHTLKVADVMLHVHAAADARGLGIRDHAELLPEFPEATRKARRPFGLAVTIQHKGAPLRLSVVPDRLFTLQQADTRHVFALEYDSGSESINARSLAKASWRRKVLGYFNAHLQERHSAAWGFQRLRVLTVTPSPTRIDNMIAAQEAITDRRLGGLFLYTTLDRLAAAGPLAPIWRSSTADALSLIPTTPTKEPTDADQPA